MDIHIDTKNRKTYIYGAIWPKGRNAAINDAQARIFARELERIKGNAA